MLVGAALVSAACVPFGEVSVTSGAAVAHPGAVSAQAPQEGIFGPRSVWKADIRKAKVGRGSARMVKHLVGQVTDRYGGVSAFNVNYYNASFFSVADPQPLSTVKWDDCQGKGPVPDGLYGSDGQFVKVPIPALAVTTVGTDSSLSIYQRSTDTLWDFWKAYKRKDGWHACWGGRIKNVSHARGYFSAHYGVSASGLSLSGGAIGIREAQAGKINHAMSLVLVRPAVHTRVSWPAQRSDGSDRNPAAIPEGTRLRLNPKLDVDKLDLHPIAKMIAKAAQKYGFIVTDRGGAVAVAAESGLGTKAATGTDPWVTMLAGTPDYLVMRNFPWTQMQTLPQNWGRPR